MMVTATMPVQLSIWSVPLAHEATATRNADTTGQQPGRSSAAGAPRIRRIGL